ncbi:uncharacterized protein [Gossypium hirsutum]|uniref:Uncharacterized protein n=1 Tax=Gossypium hirsutum TaxID=3635 RepID=A0A1U8KW29_GOSHI|nr:uncharacterized protein LOC107920198 [Gossypium hirsutum]
MAPYKALCCRKCCTLLCWTKFDERRVLGPELVFETKDKVRPIQDHLKVTSNRQKSYADLKRRDIEYSVGDFVFFKYRSDPSHVVSVNEIEVRLDLSFEEEPIKILCRDVKVLKRKIILLVKVL